LIDSIVFDLYKLEKIQTLAGVNIEIVALVPMAGKCAIAGTVDDNAR
jgi:hypothetical protein